MGKAIINSWEKKLLDIGKRNQLVNFRDRLSSTIEFYYDDLYDLFDDFTSDKSFIMAKLFKNLDEDITMSDFEDTEDEYEVKERVTNALGTMISRKDKYEKEEIEEIKKRFKPLKTKNYLYPASIYSKANQALTLLRRKSKLLREENGIESLYMCFGFVEYIEGKEKYLAPLALIPVHITSNKFNEDQNIKAIDDEFIINENFSYYTKINYKVDLNKEKDDMSLKEYIKSTMEKLKPFNCTFVDKVSLGIFSFSKIMMYNDLVNNEDKLLKNNWVKLLAGYKVDNIDNLLDDEIVEEPIINQNQVLACDSSQYRAIYYAKSGKSFVLQGPPGTGKSQTITNMLAELIGMGKKVLFVCEKSSALDVVYNNLRKCDLDRYALPIYDTKANKKEIVKDIYQNIEYLENHNVKLNDKGKKIIEKVEDSKEFFNEYLVKLNKKISPINKSLYEIINLANSNYPTVNFELDDILNIDNKTYEDMLENISLISRELDKLNQAPINHPYKGFLNTKITKKEIKEIDEASNKLIQYLESIYKTYNKLDSNSFRPKSIYELNNWINILEYSSNPYNLDSSYFLKKDLAKDLESSKVIAKSFKNIKSSMDYFSKKYKPEYLDLDISLDLKDLKEKYNLAIKRVFGYNKLVKKYQALLNNDKELEYNELVNDLTKLNELKDSFENIAILENSLSRDFNKLYFGSKTDFTNLDNIINYLIQFNEYISLVDSKYKSKIIEETVKANKEYLKEANILRSLANNLVPYLKKLESYFDFNSLNISISDLIIKLKNVVLDPESIYPYLDFAKALAKIPAKLIQIKDVILNQEIDVNNFKESFIKQFSTLLLDALYEKDQSLSLYSDSHINLMLENYKKNNDKLYDISRIKISDKVTSTWPNINGISGANLEVKTLRTEINKKRKLMSVRDLFSHMPNLLQSLKPIFMMSPLSVSNYLDSNLFEFDTVIFDEASQITTENAIGAIYRAKQLIVVGDKEQLPPTSFFDNVDTSDEDDYDIYESILDLSSTILPSIMLKWHYRSKDESLITYSNKEIYHDLVSFPSPYIDTNLGLKYECVENGVYVHNKRINLEEANRVVDLIFYQFRHNPTKSLGVVTFNMSQEQLIYRLVNQRRRKDSSYESFFDESIKEPFFIKNLETVQGDERDIIILSTTFGPDENNKQSMNFGPINKDGGYRRLNVAITRAKEELILVSSLDISRFNPDNIKSRGVRMLFGFIDYAKKRNNLSFTSFESKENFLNKIKDIFKKKGYECLTNVGDNSYKVDLAIISPNEPNRLLCGILTDGLNYQNLESTRDRNVSIDNVLRLRGWNIYHIFYMTAINNLENIIDNIIEDFGESKEIINDVSDVEIFEDIKEENVLDVKSLFDTYPNIISIIDEEAHKNNILEEKILNIIEKVSPISKKELFRLVSNPFFNSNINEEINNKLEEAINYLKKAKKIYLIVGFILRPSDLLGIRFRRYDSLNPYNRNIDSIFIEELEEGFRTIISYVKQTSKTILFKTFNTLLGYPNDSKKTIDTFNKVINVLSDKGIISLDGDVISYI